MMKNLFVVVLFFVSTLFNATGDTLNNQVNDSAKVENLSQKEAVATKIHPLTPLLNAIIYVESKGNPKAYNKNGDCVGLLQITKICVRECNNILKRKGISKRYSYSDRWDAQKSIEMFYILQEEYNPKYDLNKGIRLWNKRASYKQKIMKVMNKTK